MKQDMLGMKPGEYFIKLKYSYHIHIRKHHSTVTFFIRKHTNTHICRNGTIKKGKHKGKLFGNEEINNKKHGVK